MNVIEWIMFYCQYLGNWRIVGFVCQLSLLNQLQLAKYHAHLIMVGMYDVVYFLWIEAR